MPLNSIEGKTALVSGASRGIGRAIAVKLASLGCSVAVNHSSPASRQDAAVTVMAAQDRAVQGANAVAFVGDVSSLNQVVSLFDAVEAGLGKVDVLVNNAGVAQDPLGTAFVQTKESDWKRVVGVNLFGTMNCSYEAIRRWVAGGRKGNIVNISSVAAFTGSVTTGAHYAAAKAGVVGFTYSLAGEYGARGIVANCVAPGFVQTDLVKAIDKERMDKLILETPVGRAIAPEEVAEAVAFLASSSGISGQTLVVDGGRVKH